MFEPYLIGAFEIPGMAIDSADPRRHIGENLLS
jgi:hypothetical protein